MLYDVAPPDFHPKFETVCCYIEHAGKNLILQRQIGKPQEGKYGHPAGKVSNGESLEIALVREILEETGINAEQSELQFVRKYFVRYPSVDFVYHGFKLMLAKEPPVKINPVEHSGYMWVNSVDVIKFPLVLDEDIIFRNAYNLWEKN